MPRKKTKSPSLERAMIRDASGAKVYRKLPCSIDKIAHALECKRFLGLPIELSQAECRDIVGTVTDLKHLLEDDDALEVRKANNARRARVKKQSDQLRRERVRDNVRKYL